MVNPKESQCYVVEDFLTHPYQVAHPISQHHLELILIKALLSSRLASNCEVNPSRARGAEVQEVWGRRKAQAAVAIAAREAGGRGKEEEEGPCKTSPSHSHLERRGASLVNHIIICQRWKPTTGQMLRRLFQAEGGFRSCFQETEEFKETGGQGCSPSGGDSRRRGSGRRRRTSQRWWRRGQGVGGIWNSRVEQREKEEKRILIWDQGEKGGGLWGRPPLQQLRSASDQPSPGTSQQHNTNIFHNLITSMKLGATKTIHIKSKRKKFAKSDKKNK